MAEISSITSKSYPAIVCIDCKALVASKAHNRLRCKSCLAARNRSKSLEYSRANKVKVSQKGAERYRLNLEENRKKRREYERANPEKARARANAYYAANREKVLARMASPEGRAYSREQMRRKMQNPADRLHSNVSRAIRASVKDKGGRSWEALVGYTLDDLMRHLERQFLSGMTWENHGMGKGKWHIDHIVPRVAFNFDGVDSPEFKACWALTNLRPLWSEANRSKSAKRIFLL